MSETCKAKYVITTEELLRGARHNSKIVISLPVKIFVSFFAILLLALVAVILIAWLFDDSTPTPPFFSLILLASLCLGWLFAGRISKWYSRWSFARRPDLNLEIEWLFSDTGVRSRFDLGNVELDWKIFSKVVETPDGFLLYQLETLYYWIPFSAFESPACVGRVREMIKSNDVPFSTSARG